jgi:hypothetical protein
VCACRTCRTKEALRAARSALGVLDAALADVLLNVAELPADPHHEGEEEREP